MFTKGHVLLSRVLKSDNSAAICQDNFLLFETALSLCATLIQSLKDLE